MVSRVLTDPVPFVAKLCSLRGQESPAFAAKSRELDVSLPADFQAVVGKGLTVLDVAPLYAAAIARMHAGETVADLGGV